jgi:hypothetical protein
VLEQLDKTWEELEFAVKTAISSRPGNKTVEPDGNGPEQSMPTNEP